MSNRSYTRIKTIGPKGGTARRAAIRAIKAEPEDEYGYNQFGGSWTDKKEDADFFNDCYFDKSSGHGAVIIVAEVSRQFPAVTFDLSVDGAMAENLQGPVIIRDGIVRDGRSGFISYGDPQEPLCERCFPNAFKPKDLLPIDRNVPEGRISCPKCGTVYEYVNRKGVEWGDELIDIIEWFAVYEIPRQPSMKLSHNIRRYLRLFLRPLREFIRHVKYERQMRQWEQRHHQLQAIGTDVSMEDVLGPMTRKE
jgi:hypothetical protein